eukprot:TRINITY_DN35708_c0_g1_i1.p1 TRINITY_DN35708_c0_g1~~TRINITY_DN35708_c0_g1_i1.p1  ORF type:complete len:106 (-),score=26.82 TRINITY_DN35708_c0_g1_i1:121-438(-)
MCKTCSGGNSQLTHSEGVGKVIQRQPRQARMSFPEDRKKGEQKGLPWKEAILQTAFMEDQERDILLNGWPRNMVVRMEKQREEVKDIESTTSSEQEERSPSDNTH